MSLRKRLIAVSASVALASSLGLVVTQPAEALTSDWTKVCNSDYSDGTITVKVFNDPSVGYFQRELGKGSCTSTIWNGDDNIRVDVEAYDSAHISSYKIGEISVGWGPCHENSDNNSSNPPDSYNVNGIRYRNYRSSNCS